MLLRHCCCCRRGFRTSSELSGSVDLRAEHQRRCHLVCYTAALVHLAQTLLYSPHVTRSLFYGTCSACLTNIVVSITFWSSIDVANGGNGLYTKFDRRVCSHTPVPSHETHCRLKICARGRPSGVQKTAEDYDFVCYRSTLN